MTIKQQTMTYIAGNEVCGWRLDQFLTHVAPEYSRSRWQTSIKAGSVTLNGVPAKPKDAVYMGDEVCAQIAISQETTDQPENLPLNIIYADDDIIVIDKPAGLVVHPAAGNARGTLLNALLFHFPEVAKLPRAGIVHRLDKDTSGLMVVAHNLRAHAHLVEQLQTRAMGRTYLAFVYRYVTAGDTIDLPLGRHPRDRLKQAVITNGKEAITHYRIEERFGETATLLRIKLQTGRTHQIRVHMAHLKFPLIGDSLYGTQSLIGKGVLPEIREALLNFPRQALHATELNLIHPKTEETRSFSSPLPADLLELQETLRRGE